MWSQWDTWVVYGVPISCGNIPDAASKHMLRHANKRHWKNLANEDNVDDLK